VGKLLLAKVGIGLDEDDGSDGGLGLQTALSTAIHNLLLTIFIIQKVYNTSWTPPLAEWEGIDPAFGIIIFEWRDKEECCR
jgi:hypothetical protein